MMFFKSKEAKLAASTPPSPGGAASKAVAAADQPVSPRLATQTPSLSGLQHHASHGDLVTELVRKRGLTASLPGGGANATASPSPSFASPLVSPRGLSSSTPSLPSCPPSPPVPHLPHSPPTSPRSASTNYVPATSSPLASAPAAVLGRPTGGAGTGPLARRAPPPIPSSPKPAATVMTGGVRSPQRGGSSPASSPHSSAYSSSPQQLSAPSPSSSSSSPSSSPSSSSYACTSPLAAASTTSASGSRPPGLPPLPLELTASGSLPPVPASYPPPPPPPRKPLLATPTAVPMLTVHTPPPLGSSASFPSPTASPINARQRSNTADTALARKDNVIVRPPGPSSSPSSSSASSASSPASASPPACSPTSSAYHHASPLSPRGNVEGKARELQHQLHLHQMHHFQQQQQQLEQQQHQQQQQAVEDVKKSKEKAKFLKRTVSEKNVPHGSSAVTVTANPLMSMVSPRATKKPLGASAGPAATAAGSNSPAPAVPASTLRPRKGTEIAGQAIRRNDERKSAAAAAVPASDVDTAESSADADAAPLSLHRLVGTGGATLVAASAVATTAAATAAAAMPAVPATPLSPRELRQLVVHELVHTEASYCRDLAIVVEIWMKPLRAQGLFSADDIGVVFSNVEQLRMLNEELLTSLRGVLETTSSSGGGGDGTAAEHHQDVGRRFARFVDFLKMYFEYCANQAAAIERLQELKKAKPQLVHVLDEIKNKPECSLLDLESYLIKPMQRVTKYPLLLKEILKHTEPSHPDHAALEKCYARIAEVVLEINEKKRQSDNLMELIQLQNSFVSVAGEEPLRLVAPNRRLVAHGTFKRVFVGTRPPVTKIKNGQLFLFNDLLVVASEEGNALLQQFSGKHRARKLACRSGPIAITNVLLWSGNDPEGLLFCIVRMDDSGGQITLQASSPEEKLDWISRINDCIVTLPNGGLRGAPAGKEPLDSGHQHGVVEKFSRQQEASC